MNEKEKRQNLITKAYLMIHEANKMKDGKEKNILVFKIKALLSFLYYNGDIKLNEYQTILKKVSHFKDHRQSRKDNVFKTLLQNNDTLLGIYEDSLSLYQIDKITYYDTTVNPSVMKNLQEEFLKLVNADTIYHELKQKEQIKKGSRYVSKGLCIDNITSSYIILGRQPDNKMEYYINLIHEIGHAFTNKILQNQKFGYYDEEIYREFISSTFVRMFLAFVKDKKALPSNKIDGIIKNYEMMGYYNLYLAKEACLKLADYQEKQIPFTEYAKMVDNPYIHHTALGHLASFSLMREYMDNEKEFILDLPYTIRKFSEMSFGEILDKYCDMKSMKKILKK